MRLNKKRSGKVIAYVRKEDNKCSHYFRYESKKGQKRNIN